MAEQELHYRDTPQKSYQRSWGEAFVAFLTDKQASTLLKVLFGLGPVALLDDVIPIVGLVDEPYLVVWIFVAIIVYLKVSAYRNIPSKQLPN